MGYQSPLNKRRFVIVFGRSNISKKSGRLKVTNEHTSANIPVRYIEAVVCIGKASVSTEAINLLLSEKIPLYFMSKFGALKGVLQPPHLASREKNRLAQYKAFQEKRLDIARSIVADKIDAVEKYYGVDVSYAKEALKRLKSIDELMGIEGEISRRMFERFKENIADCGLQFGGRSYRPPLDPVNTLLSLSYTFTYFLAFPVVLFLGYDPYISFLHTKRGSHASFCSDVIEPLRPFITRRIEELLIHKLFSQKDFLYSKKGCFLKKESFPKFMNWLEGEKENIVEKIKESLLRLKELMI